MWCREDWVHLPSGCVTCSLLVALFVQNTTKVCPSTAFFGLIGASLSDLMCDWNLYMDKVFPDALNLINQIRNFILIDLFLLLVCLYIAVCISDSHFLIMCY